MLPFSSYTSLTETAEYTTTARKGRRTDARFDPHQRASGPRLAAVLEGLQIGHEPDGTSRLSGTLADQAALYGVLNQGFTPVDYLRI